MEAFQDNFKEIIRKDKKSTVYKIFNFENNSYFILNQICIDEIDEMIEKEIINKNVKILLEINHNNIIKYYSIFEDQKFIYITTEYYGNLSMTKFIEEHKKNKNYINENVIYNIVLDICLGLKELYNKKIIHRNLNPDNIFINEDFKIKITGFDLIKDLNEANQFENDFKGNINYLSPKRLSGKNNNNKTYVVIRMHHL